MRAVTTRRTVLATLVLASAIGWPVQGVARADDSRDRADARRTTPFRPASPDGYARAKSRANARGGAGGPARAAAAAAAAISPSFEGVSDSCCTPPDSTGAIGPTRYVELVNLSYGIYDRNGEATELGFLEELTGTNPALFFNLTDPQVIWDAGTQRFYFVVLDITDDEFAWGFSKTAEPSSAADFCKYKTTLGYGADIPDYPKLGDTSDFLLIGVNRFIGGAFYGGSDVAWLAKPGSGPIGTCPAVGSLRSGVAAGLVGDDETQAFTPVPANQIDDSGTGWVVATPLTIYDGPAFSASSIQIFKVTKDELTGAAVVQASGQVPVPTYAIPPNAPQKDRADLLLDTLDGRHTQAVSAVDPGPGGGNVGLWTQHTVEGGAGAEVRWYEIDPATPSLFQSGKVTDQSLYVFNGAVSPDRLVAPGMTAFGSGMALGFNTSSLSEYTAIQMVSKVGSGPQSSRVLVKQSPGINWDFSCGGSCRWGDYSGATPDPAASPSASSGSVWLTNQWNVAGDGSDAADWRTWNWAVSLGAAVPDTTPPETTITSGPSGTVASSSATFAFNANEPSTFACALDGAAFAGCDSPTTYNGLANGSHTFRVRATDTAGNTDATPASRTWNVDTAPPPTPTLQSPADGSTTADSTPTFDWSDVTDPSGVSYTVQADDSGSGFASPEVSRSGLSSSTFTPASALADGTYSWRARATDGVGNVGAWSAVFTVTVNTSQAPGSIQGTVTEANGRHKAIGGATVDCGSAGSGTTATDGTYTIPGVVPGTYSCTATAPKYKPATQPNVVVTSGQPTTVDFALSRGR